MCLLWLPEDANDRNQGRYGRKDPIQSHGLYSPGERVRRHYLIRRRCVASRVEIEIEVIASGAGGGGASGSISPVRGSRCGECNSIAGTRSTPIWVIAVEKRPAIADI